MSDIEAAYICLSGEHEHFVEIINLIQSRASERGIALHNPCATSVFGREIPAKATLDLLIVNHDQIDEAISLVKEIATVATSMKVNLEVQINYYPPPPYMTP